MRVAYVVGSRLYALRAPHLLRQPRQHQHQPHLTSLHLTSNNIPTPPHIPAKTNPTITHAIVIGGVSTQYPQNTVRDSNLSKGDKVALLEFVGVFEPWDICASVNAGGDANNSIHDTMNTGSSDTPAPHLLIKTIKGININGTSTMRDNRVTKMVSDSPGRLGD